MHFQSETSSSVRIDASNSLLSSLLFFSPPFLFDSVFPVPGLCASYFWPLSFSLFFAFSRHLLPPSHLPGLHKAFSMHSAFSSFLALSNAGSSSLPLFLFRSRIHVGQRDLCYLTSHVTFISCRASKTSPTSHHPHCIRSAPGQCEPITLSPWGCCLHLFFGDLVAVQVLIS